MLSFSTELFNPEFCNRLAKKHRFIQRASSKIQGHEFVQTLVLSADGFPNSLNSFCLRMSQINPGSEMSASALSQRINTAAAVNFMKACMEKALSLSRTKIIKQYDCLEGALSQFKNVYIQDSTIFELNKRLHKIFTGTKRGGKKGGSSCKAQVKIDLIHNYTKGLIQEVYLCEGKRPDQALTSRILSIIHKNELVIRDLGYFKLQTLKAISEIAAYFLSRLPSHLKIYLNSDDTNPVTLSEYFNRNYRYQSIIEMNVWIGEERIPSRLVAYRAPKEVVNERRRKAHKKAREMGRTLSKAKLDLLSFSLFVTNIPQEKLEAKMIGTIYRLRWEIELIFKQWKSLLHVDVLKGTNRYRVQCLILSRLCLAIVVASLMSNFMNIAKKIFDRELSPTKFILYLLRNLFKAITEGGFGKTMMKDLKRLLKDKRTRPTMREMVTESWGYYEYVNLF
jgi:hypothetical protein